jgi:hypothetical protein
VVIGAGIAAQRLSPHDTGLQLFEVAAATAGGLFAIIPMFGPVSGGHFNPAVSLAGATFAASAGVTRSPTSRPRSVAASRNYGHLAKHGRPHAIALLDAHNVHDIHDVDASWTRRKGSSTAGRPRTTA